jgi:hypothetical protein
MSLSRDEYVSFFINNYRDIEALLEICKHAKSHIPSLLDDEIRRCINEIDFNNSEVFYEDGEIFWCNTKHYIYEIGRGPYFGYESRWDSLFSGNDPADASFLYLYVDVGGLKQKAKQKEYINKWGAALRKGANSLKKKKISLINPVDYDDPYLAKYSLHREINMTTIADKDRLKNIICKTFKDFTDACQLILKNTTTRI